MDIHVKIQGEGELEKAILLFKSAKREMDAAIQHLGAVCCALGLRFEGAEKETVSATNTDGQTIIP